jgi:hypothetical protein
MMDVMGIERPDIYNTWRRSFRIEEVKIVKFIDQIERIPAGISIFNLSIVFIPFCSL